MRIGINISVLKKGENISGIGYYTYRIVKYMLENDSENQYYLFSNSELSVDFSEYENVHIIIKPCKSRLLWSRYLLGLQIKKFRLDVFWSPTHNLPIFQQNKTKYYMTVHDIANHIFSNIAITNKKKQKYLRIILNSSCKKAYRIIVPSMATKNDLVEHFDVAPERIVVVYEGGDSENSVKPVDKSELENKYKITDPYFLYVGTLQPRKNIATIVDAFINLAKTRNDIQLVLAGGIGWGMDDVIDKINTSEVKDRIILTGYVSDEEKAALYDNAEALVFPSLYEGFGIPVLESFSFGTPVITARNSSLPEVGGQAAIYINDAMSTSELTEAMCRILDLTEDERKELIDNCLKQYSKFLWKKCAEEILTLFNSN